MINTNRRKLLKLTPVVAIPLAGCNDTGGGTGANPTPTDQGTPTAGGEMLTETDSESAESVTYPPGFTDSGYADPGTALRGHIESLGQVSFTSSTEIDGGMTIRIKANPDTKRVYKVARENGTTKGEFFFEDGSAEAKGLFYGDVTSYNQAYVFDGQFEAILGATLANSSISRTDAATLITYDVVGEGETGELTVEEDGLIIRYAFEKNTESQTVPRRKYRVTDVGTTTVESPDWVEDDG